MGEYLFPVEKVTSYFKSIKSKKDLQKFIQQRSAHVTQTTLYGYLKTRIGVKFTAMVEDDVFSKSINIAKWNIYMTAIADCSLYVFSYLIAEKNLKENDCKEIYLNIIENEKANGLTDEIYQRAKQEFLNRYDKINFNKYYLESEKVISLENFKLEKQEGREFFTAQIDYFGKEIPISGQGDGILDALVEALKGSINIDLEIMEYGEHALGQGADAEAVTYIQIRYEDKRYSGVAISKDIVTSSINAFMGAASQLLSEQQLAA